MRIISGNFKNKKILEPNDIKTRPLKDLVKESIFNILHHTNKFKISLKNSNVLDLFSGVGSFGIECLSRGVKIVVFIENYNRVLPVLKKNLKNLKSSENYEIIEKDIDNGDIFRTLEKKFDIIFIDPPYKEIKINQMIDQIFEKKLLNKKGVIIIHRHKKDSVKLSEKFNVFEERIYGISKIFFGNLRVD